MTDDDTGTDSGTGSSGDTGSRDTGDGPETGPDTDAGVADRDGDTGTGHGDADRREMHMLHPLSAVIRTLMTGTAVGLGLAYLFLGGNFVDLLLIPILAVALAGTYVYQHMYVQRFRYGLVGDEVEITSGVLSRRERRIPLHRVQNIDIRRPFILSWFGINELHIETAGGGETEVSLRYVSYEDAEQFQERIRTEKNRAEQEDQDLSVDAADTGRDGPVVPERRDETPVRTTELSLGHLVVYSIFSLTRGRSTLVMGVGAGMLGMVLYAPAIFEIVPPFTVVTGLFFVALLWGQGAFQRFTQYHDTVLEEYDDRIRIEHGMFTRHERTLPREKIQSVTLIDDPVTRLLGLAGLRVNTAGYAPGEESKEYRALPLTERDVAVDTMNRIMPGEVTDWDSPPVRARRRYTVRFLIVAAGLLSVLAVVPRVADVPVYLHPALPPILLGVAMAAAHLRWKHLGYATTDESISARSGFWHREAVVVVYRRVQDVIQSETILQRRWNLATLTPDTAGSYGLTRSNPDLIDIDRETSEELRALVREKIRGEQKAMPEPVDDTRGKRGRG